MEGWGQPSATLPVMGWGGRGGSREWGAAEDLRSGCQLEARPGVRDVRKGRQVFAQILRSRSCWGCSKPEVR